MKEIPYRTINFFSFFKAQISYSRHVSSRLKVEPGMYVIIPFTEETDQEAKFLLRVLAEQPAPIEQVQ